MTSKIDRLKILSIKLFRSGIESVLPHTLIRKHVRRNGSTVTIMGCKYFLKKNCYLVGFGKAVLSMSSELEKILGEHLVTGIISVPDGVQSTLKHMKELLPMSNSVLRVMEGAKHNMPDENAENAASCIANLVSDLGSGDILFVTISGGGSALLPSPVPPIRLADKIAVIQLLTSAGANIEELNSARKSLSLLKGGGLAKIAYPAQVIALILSDIVGDPVDSIASGPTVFNSNCTNTALHIINKFSLQSKVPSVIWEHLKSLSRLKCDHEQAPVCNGQFHHVHNYVIGNNSAALESIARESSSAGYFTFILSSTLEGDVKKVAKLYSSFTMELCKFICGEITTDSLLENLKSTCHTQSILLDNLLNTTEDDFPRDFKRVCFIAGGETTVKVKGNGLGGRNQELALAFLWEVSELMKNNPSSEHCDILFLSGGTDGIDGPTEFAGAISYPQQMNLCRMKNIDPLVYLNCNNSTNFFIHLNNEADLLKIGHTGTNVMDIHLLIVESHK